MLIVSWFIVTNLWAWFFYSWRTWVTWVRDLLWWTRVATGPLEVRVLWFRRHPNPLHPPARPTVEPRSHQVAAGGIWTQRSSSTHLLTSFPREWTPCSERWVQRITELIIKSKKYFNQLLQENLKITYKIRILRCKIGSDLPLFCARTLCVQQRPS